MSERYYEALEDLRVLLSDMAYAAQTSQYGHFPGGNPNDFTPDPECSTEEERKAHEEACRRWSATSSALPGPHEPLEPPAVGWITRSGFGLGTYTFTDPQAEDWADRLARALDRLERE